MSRNTTSHFTAIITAAIAFVAIVVSSCSHGADSFMLKGKFNGLDQGEFYLYSTFSGHERLDTLRLNGGSIMYETTLHDTVVMIMLFPNFSELPIVAAPGTVVSINGDATHLKETKVEGGVDNGLLTEWRLQHLNDGEKQMTAAVSSFIRQHPASPVSLYLLRRYLLQTEQPNYSEAQSLLKLIVKASPNNLEAMRLRNLMASMLGRKTAETNKKSAGKDVAGQMPAFSATDIKGQKVGASKLKSELNIVYTWSSWESKSQEQQRMLRRLKKQYGDRLALMGFCLDADTMSVRYNLRYDSITWPVVCDGRLFDNAALRGMRLMRVPDNVMYDAKGREVARSVSQSDLEKRVKDMLDKGTRVN